MKIGTLKGLWIQELSYFNGIKKLVCYTAQFVLTSELVCYCHLEIHHFDNFSMHVHGSPYTVPYPVNLASYEIVDK